MAVHKWQADRVFDGHRFLEPGTVVITDDGGKIQDLVPAADAGSGVQPISGILTPGLINAHCHLELSHFQGQIPEGGGLVSFLLNVVGQRKQHWPPELVQARIDAAIAEMEAGGIVGVGDICNTTDAVAAKGLSRLRWHNLVEVLNFSEATRQARLDHNQSVLEQHLTAGLKDSVLTPHAPYSVTPGTFAALNKLTAGKAISVHNQETAAENELFETGSGAFHRLYGLTGTEPLGASGTTSLQSWISHFTEGQTLVLVHNTFTGAADIHFAKDHAAKYGLRLFWCLCPNANKYIENALPPLDLLVSEGCDLVLGTDSYGSNWQLSIAAELKLLSEAYPTVPLDLLLQAATRNGADAFGWSELGRLQRGTKPGLALLHTNEDGKLCGTSELVVAA